MDRVILDRRGDLVLTTVNDWAVQDLASHMRQADRDEVWASHRATPLEALTRSVQRSGGICWSVERPNRVVAIFGCAVVSLLGETGTPWLLGSDEIADIRITFLRYSKRIVANLSRSFALLENWIDVRNTLHLDWARWVGFKVDPPAPYGIDRLPFCRITMKRGEDACAFRRS